MKLYTLVIVMVLSPCQVAGFAPINQHNQKRKSNPKFSFIKHTSRKNDSKLNLFTQEQQLTLWITTFSTAHIGMSAVRDRIINGCGELSLKANIIGLGLKLPPYWPGDDFGKDEVFPDSETAGRQIYRFFYTIVSFTTLGNAFISYSHSDEIRFITLSQQDYIFFYGIASLSFAASIASLFNASPMSLMPSFENIDNEKENSGSTVVASIAGFQRNDSLKMEPKGLTRITRHPLILPVVSWGYATSYLAGGRTTDFILFGGLAMYAIAGCACQDLRIINKEGSVGTVMRTSKDVEPILQDFYRKTSFVPFAAVVDGRQSLYLVLKEFPIIPFIIAIPIGAFTQDILLEFLN